MVIEDLAKVLHPSQQYVLDASVALGVDVIACRHSKATSTCAEKARILGWPANRVVKALYFSDGTVCVGVVLPELFRQIDAPELFGDLLGISRKHAKRFRLGRLPQGMERGTCTPFPWHASLSLPAPEISRIVIHHEPELTASIVDISIGGHGELAHRLSCHLQYAAIHSVLSYTFGAMVERRSLAAYLLEEQEDSAVSGV